MPNIMRNNMVRDNKDLVDIYDFRITVTAAAAAASFLLHRH